jgi:hypothetical protein
MRRSVDNSPNESYNDNDNHNYYCGDSGDRISFPQIQIDFCAPNSIFKFTFAEPTSNVGSGLSIFRQFAN